MRCWYKSPRCFGHFRSSKLLNLFIIVFSWIHMPCLCYASSLCWKLGRPITNSTGFQDLRQRFQHTYNIDEHEHTILIHRYLGSTIEIPTSSNIDKHEHTTLNHTMMRQR
ncbi:hypothetical protein KP509_36G035200 [Ceratopteris richardii]|uniref:Uncharacterized protein n=1 Tax=Ceratopteris richardii TaxID=49495 RepID=A0A8T2QDE4_CERRI|nr:hypothetical protein KP509_36G035200 [Ceratopteris richardii]